MAIEFNGNLEVLQEAYLKGRLTLYLGAGVSKPSGLPSWEELVQALYFSTLNDESYIHELRPYPNYLFALAEWVLKQKNEPLDIIVRKIKQWYKGEEFMRMMSNTLYAGFGPSIDGLPQDILDNNSTLKAIVNCCVKSVPKVKGISSIITYNYDNLVELGLENFPAAKDNFQKIYKRDQRFMADKIPIYHVHGYIPYQIEEANYDDIIFSEDQYNRTFQDPFYWGNLVQVNHLTNYTGLMIGTSLADRNTRRIIDSVRNQPLHNDNFILMQNPKFKPLDDPSPELDHIRKKAEEYLSKYPSARLKMPQKEPSQINDILDKIYRYERAEFYKGFENFGLKLITFDTFDEIPEVLNQISNV